ncbi:MAG: DUF1820 family protein [Gammaproteobacteria bacterium]
MKKSNVYKIKFIQLGEIYEVFARHIYQSEMYGFIEVEEYIFNREKQLVVDPTSEKLKNEFLNVERSYIPLNSIVRIDEVDELGEAKITENKGQVSSFPINIQPVSNKD